MGEVVKMQGRTDEITGTQADPDVARELLRKHREATGKTQSEVARAIGVSAATLSGFLRNTYAGNVEEVAVRVLDYLQREGKRLVAPQEPGFVETSIAADVMTVAEYTHMHSCLGLVYGEAGLGKTTALERYAKAHPDVVMITAGIDVSGPKAIIEELMEALGKREYGTLRRGTAAIIDTLRDSRRLVIIDEAQHLSYRALEAIRKVHDQAKVGILLAGNREVYDRMLGRRGALFAQFFSRVGIRRFLQGVPKDDIKLVFEQNGKLSKECIDYLYEVSKGPGGLRFASRVYVLGSTIAYGAGKELDVDSLARAFAMLTGR